MTVQCERPRNQYELARIGMVTRPGADPAHEIEIPSEPARAQSALAAVESPDLRFISIQEVARLYGVNWRTALRWADCGLIPKGVKLGGRRLFRRDQVLSHIAKVCPQPA
jgi:excisionase family DNA binding protein